MTTVCFLTETNQYKRKKLNFLAINYYYLLSIPLQSLPSKQSFTKKSFTKQSFSKQFFLSNSNYSQLHSIYHQQIYMSNTIITNNKDVANHISARKLSQLKGGCSVQNSHISLPLLVGSTGWGAMTYPASNQPGLVATQAQCMVREACACLWFHACLVTFKYQLKELHILGECQ